MDDNEQLIESLEVDDTQKESNKIEKSKGCHFPTTYTILMLIVLFVFILTFIIPKGKYDTLEYINNQFVIHSYNQKDKIEKANQETLNKLNIKIDINNFKKGLIQKPISIPNTYKKIKGEKNDIFSLFLFPIQGLIESSNISYFIMILGGIIKILDKMNVLNSGISALARVTKGKEFLLICLVFIIISIGGTTFGLNEETLAFYHILMPIFLNNGLDALIGMSPIFLGSVVGDMFSTVNAFSVVIASYSAGINFIDFLFFRICTFIIGDIICIIYFYIYYRKIKKNEKLSIVFKNKKEIMNIFIKNKNNNDNINDKKNEFTLKAKLSLFLFISGFPIMIIGILLYNWWFDHMSALFLLIAIILMFISNLPEDIIIKVFIEGAGEFIGIAFVIGLARGINKILTDGLISDTILYNLSKLIKGLPKSMFSIIMLIIFIILGTFIQSSSALAVLAIPIMAPLADDINCNKNLIINAYMYGHKLATLVTPTGYILIVLDVIGVKYYQWLKFIWPLLIILGLYDVILIIICSKL